MNKAKSNKRYFTSSTRTYHSVNGKRGNLVSTSCGYRCWSVSGVNDYHMSNQYDGYNCSFSGESKAVWVGYK